MKRVVIAGGGMVGIMAALKLASKFEEVVIVEKASELGGLLNSRRINQVAYDFGTHIPALTSSHQVNELLFSENTLLKWKKLPYLKVSNYFLGQWNPESTLLDVRHLPETIYKKATAEFLEREAPDYEIADLKTMLDNSFGPTFAETVYRPVIQKILGTGLENVSPVVLLQYSLHRLIAFDRDRTAELKRNPVLDAKLGFHSYKDAPPTAPYLYPVGSGGVGTWVRSLEKKLNDAGVRIKLMTSVNSIVPQAHKLRVTLSDGDILDSDSIVWTVPVPLAYRALKLPISLNPPKFRHSTLVNIGFDRPFPIQDYYHLIWDPEILPFRVTIYPHLLDSQGPIYHLSAEILSDKQLENDNVILENVVSDLRKIGILDKSSKIMESEILHLGPAFPILSDSFHTSAKALNRGIEENFPNILLLGKASGKKFLLNETLVHAYDELDRHYT